MDKHPQIDSVKEWLRLEHEREQKALPKRKEKEKEKGKDEKKESEPTPTPLKYNVFDQGKSIKIDPQTAQILVTNEWPRLRSPHSASSQSSQQSEGSKLGKPSLGKPSLGKRPHRARLVSAACLDGDLSENPENDTKTKEYLDLCYFVMRDAQPECNGMLLRGNSLVEEKALKMLELYNMNHELASYHILNAEEMAIPELREQYLDLFRREPQVLSRVLQE